ncbi:MAG: choice-of-anchor Q domain-containing protein, partial [Anaerolineales bacterium]
MTNSTFSANSAGNSGSGILNGGTLTVTNSTFSANSANFGGGILNIGTLTVTNSTFSANSAVNSGGGVWNNGTLTVTGSTFSANSAGNSGGGIRVFSGTATLKNTIIANSTASDNCYGAFAAGSTNNMATDATCGASFTQVTTAQLNLGGLTGSPGYFPLNPGSLAIDAGTNSGCPSTDQRGVTRPQDGNGDSSAVCDIGSYESPDTTSPTLLSFTRFNPSVSPTNADTL